MDVSEAVGAVVFLASDASSYVTGREPRRRRRLVGLVIPAEVPNLVAGEERPPAGGTWLDKTRPADGGASLPRRALGRGGRGRCGDGRPRGAGRVGRAHGRRARQRRAARSRELLRERREEASELVAAETGKAIDLALGETDAAIEMGFFVAGEGRRFYGRTTTARCRTAPC